MGSFRSILIGLDVEESRVVLSEESALDAAQPSWERADRHSDATLRREEVGAVLLEERRDTQPLHLRAKDALDLGQKPSLFDGRATVRVPLVQPHRHDRQVR